MKTCRLVNGLGFSQEAAGTVSFGHLVLDLESRKVQERGYEKTLEARHVAKESLQGGQGRPVCEAGKVTPR